jgi:hypothetical protein
MMGNLSLDSEAKTRPAIGIDERSIFYVYIASASSKFNDEEIFEALILV